MKTITFKPLRRIKKTNRISVSSYMQWRKVLTADYAKFNLIIDNEHLTFNKEEFVYDHKGKQLFFYSYNPQDVPVFQWSVMFSLDAITAVHKQYGILWRDTGHTNYSMKGTDCNGIPTFSHYTADYVATHSWDMTLFEPLTVGMVIKWYGWFLWQLNNSKLIDK